MNGNIVGLDPLLDPAGLKDNGGPTQTIALLPGSPAINAGDPDVCANPPVNGVDQRGYARPGSRPHAVLDWCLRGRRLLVRAVRW